MLHQEDHLAMILFRDQTSETRSSYLLERQVSVASLQQALVRTFIVNANVLPKNKGFVFLCFPHFGLKRQTYLHHHRKPGAAVFMWKEKLDVDLGIFASSSNHAAFCVHVQHRGLADRRHTI